MLAILVMTGCLRFEYKDKQGNLVKTEPVQRYTTNPVTKTTTVQIPMGFVRDILKRNFEIDVINMRAEDGTGNEFLFVQVVEKDSRLITDLKLPNSEIRKIQNAAKLFKGKLN